MGLAQRRGKLFEAFIKAILVHCGFNEVPDDGTIVYKRGSQIMLHGLGQPHNTDVLVSPPFQIPFSFPSRLIIECKCYKEALGIEYVRGALGLRIDVNNFEILTKGMLRRRRNYRRRGPVVANIPRFTYQVAMASLMGFKHTAEEFALVHRIPLINFQNLPFADKVRDILFDTTLSENLALNQILRVAEEIKNQFVIAVLESGDIIFLYNNSGDRNWLFRKFGESVEIHFAENRKWWRLRPESGSDEAWFEVPKTILKEWTDKEFDLKKVLHQKELYFKNIYVMANIEGQARLNVLHISREFLRRARTELDIPN